MNPNQSINQQIAQVDERLTILRESWQDSKPEKQREIQNKAFLN